MNDETLEKRIREEIELARALTAILLAVRLEVAEAKAQDAFDRLAHRLPASHRN
jgi:hypothetical protein